MIPASWIQKTLSKLLEFGGILALFFLALDLFEFPPLTRLWTFLALVGLLFISYSVQKLLFGITWAERLCGLKTKAIQESAWTKRLSAPLFIRGDGRGNANPFPAIILTLAALVAAGWTFQFSVLNHLYWRRAALKRMDAHFTTDPSWGVLPFFYSLGAWPRLFRNDPVFHSLPYEKGPPSHFVGHIIARWEAPHTRVVFEGPKTPGIKNRVLLRECVLKSGHACAMIREEAIERHLGEMKAAVPAAEWEISWFEIANPAIAASDEPQGIRLHATNSSRGQERFVFVTPGGTHQAIILDYPIGPSGDGARVVFEQAIRSTRVTDDLAQGRSWINGQLQAIRLAGEPSSLPKLAETQALLLSKISVDPRTFDTYFHLGGTTLLIAKLSKTAGMAESNVAASPTLQTIISAHRYAIDISSQDPRTTQMESMIVEAKKQF